MQQGSAPATTRIPVQTSPFAAALVAAALAFTAGFADGQSYLSWHLFGANMTGNTVLLGIAATTGNVRQALAVVAPILAFVAGCGVAQRIVTGSRAWCFALEAVVLGAAAFADRSPWQLELIALAMGVQNTTVGVFATVRANTSFITGNYERLGRAIARIITRQAGALERDTLVIITPLVISYAAGAAVAGAFFIRHVAHMLLFVVVIAIAISLVYASESNGNRGIQT